MAINNRRQRRRRRHRQRICHYRLVDRQNPLENLPECEVFQRFRFRPQTILYIAALLNPFIQRDTLRNSPLNPIFQVLITLRYLATGGFYSLISDTFSSISPPSVCRVVRDVCYALCQLSRQFIKMPSGVESDEVISQFYNVAGNVKSKGNNRKNKCHFR